MNNIYYNQTVQLLTAKPEGMKLCHIARAIYNSNTSLFADEGLYRQIYGQVKRFLWKQSKLKRSPFMSADKWGHYRIKPKYAVQFELPFDDFQYDGIETKKAVKPVKVEQPSFFGW